MKQYLRKNKKINIRSLCIETTVIVTAICMLTGCSMEQASNKTDKYISKVNNIIDANESAPAFDITKTDHIVEYGDDATFIDLNATNLERIEINCPGFYVLKHTLFTMSFNEITNILGETIIDGAQTKHF